MQLKITRALKNAIVNMAKKSATMEVNTACPLMNYQPREPKNVKKLRKF